VYVRARTHTYVATSFRLINVFYKNVFRVKILKQIVTEATRA